MKKLLLGVCLLLLGSRLLAAEQTFDQFLDSFAADWVRNDPEKATALQYFSGAEQDALDREFSPFTPEARRAGLALAQHGLTGLQRFDRTKLSSSQRVSAAMFQWHLENYIQQDPFTEYYFVFNQMTGLQAGLINFLTQTHPIRNRRDIENYLARLGQAGRHMDEGVVQAKANAAHGILPPKFILTATIGQFDRFLAGTPHENTFVASLDERIAKLADVSAADRAKFVATAEQIVTESVIPAFRRASALLQSQLPQSTDDAGLWRLNGGAQAYAVALQTYTTTGYTAEQIHEMGLQEVARIEGEMDALLRELGYTDGSINDRINKLRDDTQPKEADPRARLLAEYTAIARDAEKRADLLFDLRPKAPLEVRRIPEVTERNSAPNYTQPAADGSRPGIFWVTLPGPIYPMPTMRTLTYHEAIPGHHFQIALQLEMKDLPRFRRDVIFDFVSAHGEGWALYAEKLAAESGWYDGDKVGRIGQLASALFRAKRLVVDTGLHAKHWTRQQAIDYGMPAAEVERYVVWPGQACSYKIGELKILALREKAKQVLGEKFSLKEFHNVVLRTGGVPLAVLEQVIDDYIAATKS